MTGDMGKFICLIGVDGAGKTTIAKSLISQERERGRSYRYVMCRFEHFTLLKPLALLSKCLFFRKTDYSEEGIETKEGICKTGLLKTLWKNAILFDYFFQVFFKVGMPLLLGKRILADRYIYDTLADMASDGVIEEKEVSATLKAFFRFAPKPCAVIFMDTLPQEAYLRNRAKRDAVSLEYIKKRYEIYKLFAKWGVAVSVNGSSSEKDILEQIMMEFKR